MATVGVSGRISHRGGWHFELSGPEGTAPLWFEHLDEPPAAAETLDSPLVATLLHWMAQPVDHLQVEGPVTATLLRNLDELQHVWAKWKPTTYHRIEISAEEIVDVSPTGEGAISAFSGGVDATFTLHRHARAQGPHRLDLAEALMVQGFDIPLAEAEMFATAVARGSQVAQDAGIPVRRLRTNLRSISQSWEDAFALCVASTLLTFAERRRFGLLGSSGPYDGLVLPWGSTPVQDWMASSGHMEIRHDGAGYSRSEKVAALAEWPQARDNLRVCWEGADRGRNCGRCEKCIRTILNFRAVGAGLPGCFAEDVSDRDVRIMTLRNPAVIAEVSSLIEEAERGGHTGTWCDAARQAVRRSQRRFGRRSLASRAVRAGRRVVRRRS